MKRIHYLLLELMCMIILLCGCAIQPGGPDVGPSQVPIWQEQYDLGMRYLSEGNYEGAILAFTAAIEIDPKRAPAYVGRGDAYVLSGEMEENLSAAKADYEKAIELDETSTEPYLGLADVFIRQREFEKALEILQSGLDAAGESQRLIDEIERIRAEYISEMTEGDEYGFLFTNNIVEPQDWKVNGKPFYECDLVDFQIAFPYNNERDRGNVFEHGWEYHPRNDHASSTNLSAKRNEVLGIDGSVIGFVASVIIPGEAEVRDFYFQPDLRGIKTNDTFEDVLQKIGFSMEGIQYLNTTEEPISTLMLDGKLHFAYSAPSDHRRSVVFRYYMDILDPEKNNSELVFNFMDGKLLSINFYIRYIIE